MLLRHLLTMLGLSFLANVNSCSLYVVVRPSVVCLSSLCNVRAPYTQRIEIFGNIFAPFNTLVT